MSEDALLAGYAGVIRDIYGGTGICGGTGSGQLRLQHGQFHDVVLAGGVVYRFPRDEESRHQLARRTEVLAMLARLDLPVAVPGPLASVDPGEPLGRCHAVLRRLPGEPLSLDRVRSLDARAIAVQLAGLLDGLLRAGAETAAVEVVPPADPGSWRQFAADVEEVLFSLMSDAGRHRAAAELRRVQALGPVGAALAHEDLGGTNLLWDLEGPQPQLTGVIDWDGVRLGSQATFALQQALPAALSGDAAMLADGLAPYAAE